MPTATIPRATERTSMSLIASTVRNSPPSMATAIRQAKKTTIKTR
jgi:hypothetical protein